MLSLVGASSPLYNILFNNSKMKCKLMRWKQSLVLNVKLCKITWWRRSATFHVRWELLKFGVWITNFNDDSRVECAETCDRRGNNQMRLSRKLCWNSRWHEYWVHFWIWCRIFTAAARNNEISIAIFIKNVVLCIIEASFPYCFDLYEYLILIISLEHIVSKRVNVGMICMCTSCLFFLLYNRKQNLSRN